MADLHKAFERILQRWGHDIVLQRKEGSGFTSTLERHTVRHTDSMNATKAAEERIEGVTRTADMVYYFRAEALPKEGDRIYEQQENLDGETTWLIDYAIPMRGFAGQVVYWIAGATRENPQ